MLAEESRVVGRVGRSREVLAVLAGEPGSVVGVGRRVGKCCSCWSESREVLSVLIKTVYDGRDVDSSKWVQCRHRDDVIAGPIG